MKLDIKLIDTNMPLPSYQTDGAAAIDLYARTNVKIPPWTPTLIPLNVILNFPKEYFFLLASRSSLPIKKGLMVANGVGVIDHDYSGENDEVQLQVINFTTKPAVINKGERVAQGMLILREHMDISEIQEVKKNSRGGFGSTGNK